MANKTVSLYKRTKLVGPGQELKFYKAFIQKSGEPSAEAVWARDDDTGKMEPMKCQPGTFYISWLEGSRLVRKAVSTVPSLAMIEQRRKQAELIVVANGHQLVMPTESDTIEASVTAYLAEIEATKKPKTLSSYTLSLGYFKESCKKRLVDQVDRRDLLAFAVYCRDELELSPRTVHNHFANVISWLNWAGQKELTRKGDWPVFVETEPEIYERPEYEALFAACTPEESRLFRFFLYTGFREQETEFFTWKDLGTATASVKHKPKWNWTPKAYKERSVPVPASFAAELLASKPADTKPDDLVFPAAEGGPDSHFLRKLERVVKRANLPGEWWLHKFRATFATNHLRNGVDLKTVQKWMGHSDLASTMRYLRAAEGAEVQAKVESLWNHSASTGT
jgi:integrase/recombinase XerD